MVPPLVLSTITEPLRNFIENDELTMFVPIPMHHTRLWSRGYNHAFHIAQAYGDILRIPVHTTLLTRTRTSPQQAKIKNRKERERNVHNVFSVRDDKSIPKDIYVVLIDDTTTTHATLMEARRVLEKAGYKNIRAITLAH